MKYEPDDKRERVLAAAQECFLLYGFKRTAMDDIAQRAGISRAALYLLFSNKEAIFRTLVAGLHQTALAQASGALAGAGTIGVRLAAAFTSNYVDSLELIAGSAHGNELLDLHHGVGADLAQQAEQQFHTLIVEALEQAAAHGELTFSRIGIDADQAAELLRGAARGLKQRTTPALYRQQIAHLIRIFDAATTTATS